VGEGGRDCLVKRGEEQMAQSDIGVLASTVGFKNSSANSKIAEPSSIRTLPVIDNSDPTSSNIRTSIDCYVSGQYVQKNGKRLEVTQRYSIYVSYGKNTQSMTMKQVKDRIASDFQSRYGTTFNITTIYAPDLPIPRSKSFGGVAPGDAENPIFLYGGSRLFRSMTAYEKLRTDVGVEKTKSTLNIQSIRKRYGYPR
jgi:hypothetical protein